MPTTKLSSRELNQDTSHDDAGGTIVDRLGQPAGMEDVELEIPLLRDPAHPADLR